MSKCGIYLIKNKVNNKVYVGQSSNIHRRWKEHKKAAKANKKSYLYDSIRKYGIDNFELIILEECGFDFLDDREAYWMSFYCCHDENKGYNFRPAGQRKQAVTPEARERISKRLKGKKLDPKQIEQMRLINLGKKLSDETKQKISEFHKGICLDKETKEIISQEICSSFQTNKKSKRQLNINSYKTDEFREQCRNRFLGKQKSKETKEKFRNRMLNESPEAKEKRLAVLTAVTKARWAKWREERALA